MYADKKGKVYQAYDTEFTSLKPETERQANLTAKRQPLKKIKWFKNAVIRKLRSLRESE